MTIIKKEKEESKKKIKPAAKVKTVDAVVKEPKVKAARKTVIKADVVKAVKTIRPRRKAAVKKEESAVAEVIEQVKVVPVAPVAVPENIPVVSVTPVAVEPVKKEILPAGDTYQPEVKKVIKKPVVKEPEKIIPPLVKVELPAPVIEKEIELELPINVKDLSIKLQEKPSVIIKILMTEMKVMAGINQRLDEEVVVKVCDKFGFKIKKALNQQKK